MKQETFTLALAGKELTAAFTDLTEQANGSVLLRYGETAILVTAVMSDRESSMPYFPLSVEFEEKFYAAGAIMGNRFQRREGRPSEEAVLSARIIDRTIRPLFDQSLRREIQIVTTVLAMGEEDPDVLGVIGASLALSISDIPWAGPVGAVRIGRHKETGEIIINPTYTQREQGELDFEVLACGKDGDINMIETAAAEIAEADILAVLKTCTTIHASLEAFQNKITAKLGAKKYAYEAPQVSSEIVSLFDTTYKEKLRDTLFSDRAGKAHIHLVKDDFVTAVTDSGIECTTAVVSAYFEDQVDRLLHEGALKEGKRADGRGMDEVRELFAQAGNISPILHGSGIFYRGGTHIFTALTLGGPREAMTIDTIEEQDTKKHFMHHYNFPPFSVGEAGRVGGFNRRMIGHGALAEKALLPVIPAQDTFPYTIRVVSETMASNGSSSMGSVCGATLALMDGGVPITRPVAGIASGLMMEGENYVLLTDIQGPEDEHGDMDFKVAGTRDGVTAIQMDVKVDGIPVPILGEALEKAKAARLQILEVIEAEIAAPRESISSRAPEIVVMHINPEQIGLVIGSGGKTINAIKDETVVEDITIEDSGTIYITGCNGTASTARERIEKLTRVFAVDDLTEAVIVKLTDFGAFARLENSQEGLVHISEIAPFRLETVTGILEVGETVPVVVSKIEHGKIGLSIKQADPDFASKKGIQEKR